MSEPIRMKTMMNCRPCSHRCLSSSRFHGGNERIHGSPAEVRRGLVPFDSNQWGWEVLPNVRRPMRRPKYEFDPNSATVEHIVPLSIGGDNKTNGQFPNCIPMCHACNQARNKVVLKFGKSIGVVKFLIEQVYCKGVRLAEKYLNAFKRFVSREKSRKAKKKREPLAVSSSSQPMTYGPKTIQQVSKFDLSHRSSVVALSQCFDQVWTDEEAVHESHVHSSVRDGWFPIVEGRGRVQYRSKKKVKLWMKKYLSGQISQSKFLHSFSN